MENGAAPPNNFKYTAGPRLPELPAVELVFAGTWLLVIALLNVFYAIAVIAGSDMFITTASWLVGDTRPWGWLMLGVGLVQLAAAPGVFLGRWWALWVALLSVVFHIAAAVMFIQDSALIAVCLLLLDAAVLFSVVSRKD